MESAPDLDLAAVSKRFDDHLAVDDVSFTVAPGEFFSILGPSGCGKTTLVRMIAGFDEPSAGEIRIRGRSVLGVPANRRPCNMVFQSLALFPMMSVGENIAYGLRCHGVGKAEAAERTGRMLDRVGLPGFADRRSRPSRAASASASRSPAASCSSRPSCSSTSRSAPSISSCASR